MIILSKCKLESQDCVDAYYLSLRSSGWIEHLTIAFVGLCLFMIFSLGVDDPGRVLSNFAAPLLFLLACAFYLFVFMPWRVRRVFSQEKTRQAEYEVSISPEAIESTSDYGETRIPFSAFDNYRVSDNLILLYFSPVVSYAFPRRHFASDEDFETFLSYLRANLGKPKR